MVDLAALVVAALLGANLPEDDECRDLTPKASSRGASASTARAHASPVSRPASGPIRKIRRLPTEDRCNEAVTTVSVPTFRTVERIDLDGATWEEQGGALETLEGLRVDVLPVEEQGGDYPAFGWSTPPGLGAPPVYLLAPPAAPIPEPAGFAMLAIAFGLLYLRRRS